MKTILVILGLLLVGAGVIFYLIKKGKVKDSDGDYIPDVVEDAVEDVKETAKEFNLPYKEYKTTRKAIAAHFKFLKEMGMKPAMQA